MTQVSTLGGCWKVGVKGGWKIKHISKRGRKNVADELANLWDGLDTKGQASEERAANREELTFSKIIRKIPSVGKK